jgi:ribosomal protein S18 acetylase RimI-like enzyme
MRDKTIKPKINKNYLRTTKIIYMIRIRKATKEDVAYIAEGIYHAFLLEDEGLYNQWIRTLKEVCAQEDTHYSYKNTWIAEVDRERAGMMIAVDGEHYREQRDKMYPQLKELFDVAFGKGWDEMEDEAKAGEFYIDSLAVSLPYRNQGVGTALVEKAKEMAKEIGIERVTLAVEPKNTAKKLYQRLGFVFEREITIFNEVYHLYARK